MGELKSCDVFIQCNTIERKEETGVNMNGYQEKTL